MKYSQLLKQIDLIESVNLIIPIDKIKAQYNPERFNHWKSLHKGPDYEVLNMNFSPHCRFLKEYKNIYPKDTSYYKMHKLYGKSNSWINQKIDKFIALFETIKNNDYKNKITILDKPLIENNFNNSFEIFEGHHRVAICLTLNYENIPCYVKRIGD